MGLSTVIIISGLGIKLEDETVLSISVEYAEEVLEEMVDKDLVVQEHDGRHMNHREKEIYKRMNVEATAYISYCDTGCTGVTRTGTNVQDSILHPSGLKIVATDPDVIPLGSIVEIDGELYVADDTGGAIKGKRIDLLMGVNNAKKARKFGRQDMSIKVLNEDISEVSELDVAQ